MKITNQSKINIKHRNITIDLLEKNNELLIENNKNLLSQLKSMEENKIFFETECEKELAIIQQKLDCYKTLLSELHNKIAINKTII